VRGVVAADLVGVVDGSVGFELSGFAVRLKRPAKRPHTVLSHPAVLPFPLMALAACGGGAASAPPPAPAPTVVAPTIAPVTPPAVAPGTTTATGNVLPTANQSGAAAATINAVSLPGGASGTVGSALATPLGDFTLRSDGSYSFVVANNDAVKSLPNGVTQDITINFTAGNSGGNTSSSIKLTITGINDAPVATNDSITAPVVVTAPITGNVLSNDSDIDRGTTLSVTGITAQVAQVSASLGSTQNGNAVMSAVGTFGSISINSDGSYSYTLDKADSDFIALRGGQTASEAFEYSVSDGAGGTAKAALNIVVTGVNDAPTVSNASGNVTEDAAVTTSSGMITSADPDTGQSVTIASVNATAFVGTSTSFNGTYGNLLLNSSGTWTYTLDNARTVTNALAGGQQVTETFAVTARDPLGATGTGNIVVTVTGSVDGVSAIVDSGASVIENAATTTATGNVLTNDIGTGLVVSAVNSGAASVGQSVTGTYGSIVITSNGSYTYTLNNADADTNNLAAGVQVNDVFSYSISNGVGGIASSTVSVRITGVNDAPTLSNGTGAVTEDATPNTATGMLTVSDIDNGQVASISSVNGTSFAGTFTSFNGTYGTLGLNSSGAWTYTLDNARAATNALAGGQQVTETFAVTARDPLGATGAGNIVVTVTGAAELLIAQTDNLIFQRIGGSYTRSINLLANDQVAPSATAALVSFLDQPVPFVSQDRLPYLRNVSAASNGLVTVTFDGTSLSIDNLVAGEQISFISIDYLIGASGAFSNSSLGISYYHTPDQTLLGDIGNNILTGTTGLDIIDGGAGDDILIGNAGNDRIIGGLGFDTADYSARNSAIFIRYLTDNSEVRLDAFSERDILDGVEKIIATDFDDFSFGTPFDDIVVGLGGNDFFYGSGGNDQLFGGDGNDTLRGDDGDDYLKGGPGNDTLEDAAGSDQLFGDEGDDYISSDHSLQLSGNDLFDGGLGRDTLSFRGSGGGSITIDPEGQLQLIESHSGSVSTIKNIEYIDFIQFFGPLAVNFNGPILSDIVLSQGNDIISGTIVFDNRSLGILPMLQALNGYNKVNLTVTDAIGLSNIFYLGGGNSGNEFILDGNSKMSVFTGSGNDIIRTGSGNDELAAGAGTNSLDGGAGIDTVNYYEFAVSVNLELDHSTSLDPLVFLSDSLANIENVYASEFNDKVIGDENRNYLRGQGGNDVLSGQSGNDYVQGGSGADLLVGGAGIDTLLGDQGNDILIDAQSLAVAGSSALMYGGDDSDILVCIGSNAASQIIISGGTGTDTFVFATERSDASSGFHFGSLRVIDFSRGESDKIDLSDLRDASGNVLDLQDVLDHSSISGGKTVIDLGSYKSNGHSVSGTLTLDTISSPSTLIAADFVFSGGVDWAAALPSDISLY
jgi:VCBS repeat-containing protein